MTRKDILKQFNIPRVEVGKVDPFDEKEYLKAVSKLKRKALKEANKELKKLLKKKGIKEDIRFEWRDN